MQLTKRSFNQNDSVIMYDKAEIGGTVTEIDLREGNCLVAKIRNMTEVYIGQTVVKSQLLSLIGLTPFLQLCATYCGYRGY